MSTAVGSLNGDGVQLNTELDSIIIKKSLETIQGGRTLDVTDFAPKTISSGHVVIQEIATGICKPMPVNVSAADAYGNVQATTYKALPAGYRFLGIQVQTVLTKRPFVAVMVRGAVNPEAPVLAYTADMKAAFPLITFIAD